MARGMGGKSPANVTKNLKGVDFPADRKELVAQAKRNGAEREVIEALNRMPDQEYGSMAEVMKGFGKKR